MNEPKVLVFDLEVAPDTDIVKACDKIGLDERTLSWGINAAFNHVTCISSMWLGHPNSIEVISLKDHKAAFKANPSDDIPLLKDFSKRFRQADFTVAHYGEKFDIPFLNTRIEKAGLPQLTPAKLRDTWRILRAKFKLPNNRLDTALRFFGSPTQKPALDWKVWHRVSLGDVTAFGPMIARNKADTVSLEWLYREKLRKYDNQAPNFALYSENRVCRFCGSKNLKNDRHLPKNVMLTRCDDCKGYTKIKAKENSGE